MTTEHAARSISLPSSNGVHGPNAGCYAQADCIVVWVKGEIDLATGPDLREALADAVDHAVPRVVVDLSAVTFMDSTGFNLLLGAWRAVEAAGGDICLVGACDSVRRVFDLLCLDQIFSIHPTLAGAVIERPPARRES